MTLKTRILTTIAATAVAATAVFSTVSAQPPAGRGPGGRAAGPGGPFPVLRQLNLTDEQRAQIRALTAQQRSETDQGQASKTAELQRALRAAVFADTPDPAQIDQLKAEIAQAETAALAARVDLQLKIAQVLTPDQRKQARESAGSGPGRARRDMGGMRGMRSMH
jgi:Spy/CpxP family protein refolding chaperone